MHRIRGRGKRKTQKIRTSCDLWGHFSTRTREEQIIIGCNGHRQQKFTAPRTKKPLLMRSTQFGRLALSSLSAIDFSTFVTFDCCPGRRTASQSRIPFRRVVFASLQLHDADLAQILHRHLYWRSFSDLSNDAISPRFKVGGEKCAFFPPCAITLKG